MASSLLFFTAALLLVNFSSYCQADRANIFPNKFVSSSLSLTSEELSKLETLDLQGQESDSSTHIKLTPVDDTFSGVFHFKVPNNVVLSTLINLKVFTNFRAKGGQTWTIDIKNFNSKKWTKVAALNSNSYDENTATLKNSLQEYVNKKNKIYLRISTNGARPGFIDFLKVRLEHTPVWVPRPGDNWEWVLQGKVTTSVNVEVYDVDLFDIPKKTIKELHNLGRKVICYFSAGSWENWRSDADDFPESVKGNPLDEWPGEKWLDISKIDILEPIMTARMDLAVAKKCDAVEPDNIDGFQNNNGLGLTSKQQLKYNKFLATEAHKRGLSIALKNDLSQVKKLEPVFDFAINEQCFEYDECNILTRFIKANKAVFGVEYELAANQFCDEANEMQFSFWKKPDDYLLKPNVGTPCFELDEE